jgi:dolichol-phosphate mannosyltransferase
LSNSSKRRSEPADQPTVLKEARTIAIVPTYNESENLSRLVPTLLKVSPSLEVLVIDDASPDGTGDTAESFAERTDRVQVIHRASKLGLGSAYLMGFRYALDHEYDYVVQMDADFSHRPEDLPRLLNAARSADLVIGSRNVPGGRVENWSLLRRTVSRGGSFYARNLLKLPIRDCTSGFKCWRKEALKALDLGSVASNGYGFQVEMNYLCHCAGLRIAEVPIVFPDRVVGRSKMSSKICLEAAVLAWKLRSRSTPVSSGRRADAGRPRHRTFERTGMGVKGTDD